MERQFSVGLVLGLFISGVACVMITVSQQLGIGLISTAIVLGYLFVCPKSPVKKKWWSVSSKLGITLADSSKVRMSVNEESLAFRVGLIAMSSIQVNKIGLRIGRRTLWSDWTPMEIGGIEGRNINFSKPDWLRKGCYDATLYAYTPDGFSRSNKFYMKVT